VDRRSRASPPPAGHHHPWCLARRSHQHVQDHASHFTKHTTGSRQAHHAGQSTPCRPEQQLVDKQSTKSVERSRHQEHADMTTIFYFTSSTVPGTFP
jgi:hypothetical protein